MDEKNKKAWQNNREKNRQNHGRRQESRMERSGCVMWKNITEVDTNITKAVDRVSFASKKENLWESWEHRVPERQHF